MNAQSKHCAAPWRGLHINPRGDVKVCCAGNPNMLGNLNTQSITEILHSDTLKSIRQSVRQGVLPAYCENCIKVEQYGPSERNWHNSLNPNFDPATANDNDHVPVLADLRWNITCNLSCNYCDEKSSSRWAAMKAIPFRSGARPYFESVVEYIQQHKQHLKEVALVGGEPLLLPENDRLLDVIPAHCVVTLITNLSCNLDSNSIFQKLCDRDKVGWSISFDNIQERFEYVRFGAKWTAFENNLDKIITLMRSREQWGGMHAVYNIYSATRLTELVQYARNKGITMMWQPLHHPDYLDPNNLGKEIKQLAHSEIHAVLQRGLCLPMEQDFLQQVLANTSKDDLRPQFRQHIEAIETKFHASTQGRFAKLWPEIAQHLD